MQTSALPSLAVGSNRVGEPHRPAERLPLRVSLPLIFLASASLWWVVWRGVNALL